jgi:secondary thiamine-phosphate synthase enzyme
MMQQVLTFQTTGRSIVDITAAIEAEVQNSHCEIGICHLFIQHTSASLIICENSDPQVRKDLERFMSQLVPDGTAIFQHTAEGPDDMPAHVRTVLTQTSLTIPIKNHRLALGQWQGIYLWEHRHQGLQRQVVVTIQA